MRLVVCDPARDEASVPLHERPRIRLPQLERIGRLDVEVGVDDDGRRALGSCLHLADDERSPVPLLDLCGSARSPDPLDDPVRCAAHVARVRGVGADGGDRDQLGELGDEVFVAAGHPRGSQRLDVA